MSTPKDTANTYSLPQAGNNPEPTSNLAASSWSYEETVRQVETIMARIESGELALADVFDQFADAVNYLRQCEHFLSQRQQQMDLLIETLTDEPE